jgi:hypothetical protein
MLDESGIATPVTIANSYCSDDVFDSSHQLSSMSRKHIHLNQSPTSTLDRRPISVIHHTAMRNSSLIDSPSVSSTSSSPAPSAKYMVQTTSFPENKQNETKIDRTEAPIYRRKYPLSSTSSAGFQIQQQQRSAVYTPILVQKPANEREESPLPTIENPLFHYSPPRKPPRTFEHENRYDHLSKIVDQKVPSSSSSASDSPTFDLGKF